MKEIEFVPTNYPSDLTHSQWAEIKDFEIAVHSSETIIRIIN